MQQRLHHLGLKDFITKMPRKVFTKLEFMV
jgi:hypothetical protein